MRFKGVVVVAGILAACVPASTEVSSQAPGSGWLMAPAPARTIKSLYWKAFDQTEVWMLLAPRTQDGKTVPAELVFSALFKGDLTKPGAIAGPPDELTVQAYASPTAFYVTAALKFVTKEGQTFDLAARGAVFSAAAPCATCASTSIRATLDANALSALARSKTVAADVLGMACQLDHTDTDALTKYARYIKIVR
jgi:hypothetical protein